MTQETILIENPETPILIVEDTLQYAMVLMRLLQNGLGYSKIYHVESSNEGWELFSKNPEYYRLLFIDMHYPQGMDGVQLINKIKKSGMLKGKAAFLITSEPSLENAQKATEAGAIGLIAKPFDRTQILTQLERAKRALYADSQEYF